MTNLIEPLDSHNMKLIDNVHPQDWVNPKPEGRYNLVVIGAGTAGLVAAAGAAGLGGKCWLRSFEGTHSRRPRRRINPGCGEIRNQSQYIRYRLRCGHGTHAEIARGNCSERFG